MRNSLVHCAYAVQAPFTKKSAGENGFDRAPAILPSKENKSL
jgi:hypothetical protein